VLVDTGMIDVRPEVDDMSPTRHPENIPRDIACVINTHLHFDHCGGNRLFPGVPIHAQARELAVGHPKIPRPGLGDDTRRNAAGRPPVGGGSMFPKEACWLR
jgi:glyoxylase-like metal-dependent hydrolase (beta-lactamase superfamily II)